VSRIRAERTEYLFLIFGIRWFQTSQPLDSSRPGWRDYNIGSDRLSFVGGASHFSGVI